MMKSYLCRALIWLAMTVVFIRGAAAQEPTGTAFTYQGQLNESGAPAEGDFDFQFSLYDAATSGTLVGTAIAMNAVTVSGGSFNVDLDFGAEAFKGDARWLEIGVTRTGSGAPSVLLSPRQRISPTPYSIHAATAETAKQAETVTTITPTTQVLREFTVAAGETIAAGDVVGLLNGEATKGFAASLGELRPGAKTLFEAANIQNVSVSRLTHDRVVVGFLNGFDSEAKATIGFVENDAVTFAPPVVFHSVFPFSPAVIALSPDTIVAFIQDGGNSNRGTAIVGRIAGGSSSYGARFVFNPADTPRIVPSALSASRFVVAYTDMGGNNPKAVVGEVSGNSIVYGFIQVIDATSTQNMAAATLAPDKFVVVLSDQGNGSAGTAFIGEISGNTITFGAKVVYNPMATSPNSVAVLSPQEIVVSFRDTSGGMGISVAGAVVGNAVTFGTPVPYSADSGFSVVSEGLSASQFVVAFTEGSTGDDGLTVVGSVADGEITFGPTTVFEAGRPSGMSLTTISPTRAVIAYRDELNLAKGTAVPLTLNTRRPIGIARGSAMGGESVSVVVAGTSGGHSGLTVDEFYYAAPDGSIGTSPTEFPIGVAISSSEITMLGGLVQRPR